jgi:hypothetical protein
VRRLPERIEARSLCLAERKEARSNLFRGPFQPVSRPVPTCFEARSNLFRGPAAQHWGRPKRALYHRRFRSLSPPVEALERTTGPSFARRPALGNRRSVRARLAGPGDTRRPRNVPRAKSRTWGHAIDPKRACWVSDTGRSVSSRGVEVWLNTRWCRLAGGEKKKKKRLAKGEKNASFCQGGKKCDLPRGKKMLRRGFHRPTPSPAGNGAQWPRSKLAAVRNTGIHQKILYASGIYI